jgi:hypothetical protein
MHMPLSLAGLRQKPAQITIIGVQSTPKLTAPSAAHEHPVKQPLLILSIS